MTENILKKTAAGNYRADSVKKYVKELKTLYDQGFAELRERMITLRDENRRLRENIGRYKLKERSISTAVVTAEEVAQRIVAEAEFNARKRIAEAEEYEKRTKRIVDSYIERLFTIEKSIAALLNEVIETASALKEGEEGTLKDAYESAAEIYHMLNGLKNTGPEKGELAHSIAV